MREHALVRDTWPSVGSGPPREHTAAARYCLLVSVLGEAALLLRLAVSVHAESGIGHGAMEAGKSGTDPRFTSPSRARSDLPHGKDRIRVGEGQFLDEVVLLVLATALRRGPVLASVKTPRVLRQSAVHALEPTTR